MAAASWRSCPRWFHVRRVLCAAFRIVFVVVLYMALPVARVRRKAPIHIVSKVMVVVRPSVVAAAQYSMASPMLLLPLMCQNIRKACCGGSGRGLGCWKACLSCSCSWFIEVFLVVVPKVIRLVAYSGLYIGSSECGRRTVGVEAAVLLMVVLIVVSVHVVFVVICIALMVGVALVVTIVVFRVSFVVVAFV